jgi:hypothetical protein
MSTTPNFLVKDPKNGLPGGEGLVPVRAPPADLSFGTGDAPDDREQALLQLATSRAKGARSTSDAETLP